MKRTTFILVMLLLTNACTRPASTFVPGASPTGSVRLCGASDLQTSSSSHTTDDSSVLGVTLVNQSETPCDLEGRPAVTLTDNDQPLDVVYVEAPQEDPPAPETLTIAPGESAIAILIWRNYCRTALNGSPTIQFALHTGESLEIKADSNVVPACDLENDPSTLTVNPYSYPP